MASMTASVFACSSSTTSMRVRSMATAACPASASRSWRWSSGRPPSASALAEREHADRAARRSTSGTWSHSPPGSVSVPRPGRLVVLPHPGRGAALRLRAARRPAGCARADGEPAAVGQQDAARPPNSPPDVLDDRRAAGRRRRRPPRSRGERVERRGARLAAARRLGLVAHARRQVAGEHGDQQEDEQRQHVLRLRDREGVDAARRRRSRRPGGSRTEAKIDGPSPPTSALSSTPARKTMAGSSSGRIAMQRRARRPPAAAIAASREGVAAQPERGRRGAGVGAAVGGAARRLVAGDHADVDVAALADHVVDRRRRPTARASASAAACRG